MVFRNADTACRAAPNYAFSAGVKGIGVRVADSALGLPGRWCDRQFILVSLLTVYGISGQAGAYYVGQTTTATNPSAYLIVRHSKLSSNDDALALSEDVKTKPNVLCCMMFGVMALKSCDLRRELGDELGQPFPFRAFH